MQSRRDSGLKVEGKEGKEGLGGIWAWGLGPDLAPATRGRTQIDDALHAIKQIEALVKLKELEGRSRSANSEVIYYDCRPAEAIAACPDNPKKSVGLAARGGPLSKRVE